MSQKAVFAAGCFWGIEAQFRLIKGVLDAQVGYIGGSAPHPSYEQVCTGETGHAEAVEVVFDPSIVSFESLVRSFFELHDPTQVNRQGPDVGTQYRSAIFYLDDNQREVAERVKLELGSQLTQKVATEISAASEFFRAEEYHQRYLEKKGLGPVCGI